MLNVLAVGRYPNRMLGRYVALAAIVFAGTLAAFAQTTPTIALISSINPGINGQPITFTATITGTIGNPPPVPTGTVTFLDAGTALYSPVTVNATGAAVFTISTLSAATHSITASYSGDSNYLPVTSSALSEVVVPAPVSDYTLTAPVLTQTVEIGSSTSYSLTVTPTNGYNGTVTFACVGLPVGTACTFSPTSLTPNDTETELISSLTVTTTGTTSALQSPGGSHSHVPFGLASIGSAGLLAFVLLGSGREPQAKTRSSNRARSACTAFLTTLAIGLVMMFSSCGGSSASGNTTPIGTQTFTVNATGTAGTNGGNTAVHQLSLTLIVTTVTS